jgi:hypothetical protein
MAWWLHLTNQSILRLDILGDDPLCLAAWVRNDKVEFYELMTGTTLGEQSLIPPESKDRGSEEWREFLVRLVAPGSNYLPLVKTTGLTVFTTDDGRMRLYYAGGTELILDNDGNELALDNSSATRFVALAMDRQSGQIAALDRGGDLFIYQRHVLVGAFDLGLSMDGDLRPTVAVTQGGKWVFVTDGQVIVCTDFSGAIRKKIDVHHFVRLMACSPGGTYLVTCDMETGVIRVYGGDDLTLSHQRFAIDLVAGATQVQLMANLPPASVAPSALTVNDEGVLAFAMAGVVCVTDLSHLDHLPRP